MGGVGGMMGGMNMPEHKSWAGAVWGGTKQAAENVYSLGKQAVTGESHCGPHTFKADRGMSLKMIPGAVSGAFKAHTFSVRQPEQFAEMQKQIKAFQAGPGAQAAGTTPTPQ